MNWLERLVWYFTGRRAATPTEPFPDAWLRVLESDIPFYRRLPRDQRGALLEYIQRFIAEKTFWGSRGLMVTDEMKVVIAAYACLLVLNVPQVGLYPRTREVIVYPGEFGETTEAVGPDGQRYDIRSMRIGEARYRGPVLLAWGSIKGLTNKGQVRGNVIIHEFAHALDSLDGLWDGTPPLASDHRLSDWVRVFTAEYQALLAADDRGQPTLLGSYAATNPAEFFAVASEHFFQQPRQLRKHHRELYRQLLAFYGQDPAGWAAWGWVRPG